jgi:hypothetical protein
MKITHFSYPKPLFPIKTPSRRLSFERRCHCQAARGCHNHCRSPGVWLDRCVPLPGCHCHLPPATATVTCHCQLLLPLPVLGLPIGTATVFFFFLFLREKWAFYTDFWKILGRFLKDIWEIFEILGDFGEILRVFFSRFSGFGSFFWEFLGFFWILEFFGKDFWKKKKEKNMVALFLLVFPSISLIFFHFNLIFTCKIAKNDRKTTEKRLKIAKIGRKTGQNRQKRPKKTEFFYASGDGLPRAFVIFIKKKWWGNDDFWQFLMFFNGKSMKNDDFWWENDDFLMTTRESQFKYIYI